MTRTRRPNANVLGVILALVVVGTLTLMFLPAVNLAGTTPPPAEKPQPPAVITTPFGEVSVLNAALGAAVVIIALVVGTGLVVGLALRAAEPIARAAGPLTQPAPKTKAPPSATPAPPSRRMSRTAIVLSVLALLAAVGLAIPVVMNPPQFSQPVTNLLIVVAVVVVFVVAVGGGVALLLAVLDRMNRAPAAERSAARK